MPEPRLPKQRNYSEPTHREKYPIRDSAYFKDTSIIKCAYCFEPATELIHGDVPVCYVCLPRVLEKKQYSYRIYREIENTVKKIKGVSDPEMKQWDIEFVVTKLNKLPRQLKIYYMVRDRKESEKFKPQLEVAHRELAELMKGENEFKETVQEIYRQCSEAIHFLYNVVSTMVSLPVANQDTKRETLPETGVETDAEGMREDNQEEGKNSGLR